VECILCKTNEGLCKTTLQNGRIIHICYACNEKAKTGFWVLCMNCNEARYRSDEKHIKRKKTDIGFYYCIEANIRFVIGVDSCPSCRGRR